MKQKIQAYFTAHEAEIRSRMLALLAEMVRERTVNVVTEKLAEHPYLKLRGEEYRVARIVKREMEALGIPYDEHARVEGRPNVIGRLGRDESGQRLFMAAHMDIVPAGDGWSSDPFEMRVEGDTAYGRGVLDNKGPLAAILSAARILKEVVGEEGLRGQLQIAALSDEEATDPDGVDYGIGFLIDEGRINPTMAIIPDIGENMKKIDIAEKGRAVIKLTAFGKQAHGSTPERGINAVYRMARLIREIEALRLEYVPHEQLGEPTLNLGEIHGGAAPNIVPGECVIYLDIRTVPGMTREGLVAQLQACCGRVEGEFQMEVQDWSEPHQISPENALVYSIQDNCEAVLGFRPEVFGMGGGTFAKTLNLAGITAVGWGPGDDDAFHVTNEYVDIRQLLAFCRLTCLIAADLLA
jgi:succinyl-diaminopimelate desuccinylase